MAVKRKLGSAKGGRPKIGPGKSRVFSLRLDEQLYKRIQMFAASDRRETSAAIRVLIEDGLDKRKH